MPRAKFRVRRNPPVARVEQVTIYRAQCPHCNAVNRLTVQTFALARHSCGECEEDYLIRPEGQSP